MLMMSENPEPDLTIDTLDLAVQLTTAWLSNQNTRASETQVLDFLREMHSAVEKLLDTRAHQEPAKTALEHVPAVSVRKSLASKDHIISLINGKPYRTLRRHLAIHGLTPSEYRERYGLKADYPMVATTYSEARRTMAKKIGLGGKTGMTRKTGANVANSRDKSASVS